MYTHAYFVPTHRDIEEENLKDYFAEAAFANGKCGVQMPLVIVDEKKNSVNLKLISSLKKDFPQTECFYISNEELVPLYDKIKAALGQESAGIFGYLYPRGIVNYGNTFNKLYIISFLLGNDFIHRRDSDIRIQKVAGADGKSCPVYPVETEVDYLSTVHDNRRIFVAGGGYRGKWGLDIDFLIRNEDHSLLLDFFTTLSIEEKYHDIVLQEHLAENNSDYEQDKLEIHSRKEADCGNIALYEIFKHIPCSPVPYALGSDYFTHAILIETGLGTIYHNRAVEHRYTPCRYGDYNKILNYWQGVAYLIDYQYFYRRFYLYLNDLHLEDRRNIEDFAELNREIKKHLEIFIKRFSDRKEDRRKNLSHFFEIISTSDDGNVVRAIKALEEKRDMIVDEIDRYTLLHADLLGAWPEIYKAAVSLRTDSGIQKIFETAKI